MSIREWHEKNDYVVKVQQGVDEKSIIVNFPANILYPPYYSKESFVYKLKGTNVERINCDTQQDLGIESPIYAQRLLVCEDIVLRILFKKHLSCNLIVCYDKDDTRLSESYDLTNLLPVPIDEPTKELENNLQTIFIHLMSGKGCQQLAQNSGVFEGYELLLTVFRMGGFD